jgi:hypothetical protein
MKATIDLRDEFFDKLARATDPEHGSNDDEHDLLMLVELIRYGASEDFSVCQDCTWVGPDRLLREIRDLHERVAPGEPMPSGECPVCHALCQQGGSA